MPPIPKLSKIIPTVTCQLHPLSWSERDVNRLLCCTRRDYRMEIVTVSKSWNLQVNVREIRSYWAIVRKARYG
ncbi:hypothetical protein BDZ89DRAFT_1078242, partial [Hymenopellis radicata]